MVNSAAFMRYGFITQIDYQNGVARVYIEELDIMTDWATLPKLLNQNWIIPINSQALVMYDGRENYEILNIIPYENENSHSLPPDWANEYTEGVQFTDGSKVIYDSENKKMTIDAPSAELEITCKKIIAKELDVVSLKASDDVMAGTVSLKNHIHGSPSGNTTTPIITT